MHSNEVMVVLTIDIICYGNGYRLLMGTGVFGLAGMAWGYTGVFDSPFT